MNNREPNGKADSSKKARTKGCGKRVAGRTGVPAGDPDGKDAAAGCHGPTDRGEPFVFDDDQPGWSFEAVAEEHDASEHLSRPLDVHRHSEHPELRRVLSRIADEVAAHLNAKAPAGAPISVSVNGVPLPLPSVGADAAVPAGARKRGRPVGALSANDLAKVREHVRRVLLDLILEQAGQDRCVGYSQRSERFVPGKSRYNRIHFAQRPLVRAVNALKALGYVVDEPGYRDRETKKLMSRLMQGTDQLRTAWSQIPNPRAKLERDPAEETIILRDADDDEVEYDDSAETLGMRQRLASINSCLQRADIRLRVPDSMIRDTVGFGGFDPTAKTLVRIFKLGKKDSAPRFDRGGRFYRAWWQNIPSEFRPRIEIDGQPCCEVDYSGLHFTLMYSELGLRVPADPYLPPGVPAELRPLAKVVANVLINAEDKADAGRGLWKHFLDNYAADCRRQHYEKAKALMQPVLAFHEPIRCGYLYSGHGARLQAVDARIAELVMQRMPVAVLPVHDSFLVDHVYHGLLITEMERAYREVVGDIGELNCSVKWDDAAELFSVEDLSDWTTYLLSDA